MLADYPSGCDPATRVTAGIQETWEIHPPETEPAGRAKEMKRPKRSKDLRGGEQDPAACAGLCRRLHRSFFERYGEFFV